MGSKSKQKGKRGEREAAKVLSEIFGLDVRRGVQYQGSPDSPDVVGIPGLHVEVKRCENLSLYKALEQAVQDSGENVPVVMHKRNRKPWVIILQASDLRDLYAVLRSIFDATS